MSAKFDDEAHNGLVSIVSQVKSWQTVAHTDRCMEPQQRFYQSSGKLTSPTPEATNFWHKLVEFASEVARLASEYKCKENNW